MTIEKFKSLSHGVGGSYTRWQGKPPAHAVFYAETDAGQTAFTAYDLTERVVFDDAVRIDGADAPMGPKSIPFKCDVCFDDLPAETQAELRERAAEHFETDDFFN